MPESGLEPRPLYLKSNALPTGLCMNIKAQLYDTHTNRTYQNSLSLIQTCVYWLVSDKPCAPRFHSKRCCFYSNKWLNIHFALNWYSYQIMNFSERQFNSNKNDSLEWENPKMLIFRLIWIAIKEIKWFSEILMK